MLTTSGARLEKLEISEPDVLIKVYEKAVKRQFRWLPTIWPRADPISLPDVRSRRRGRGRQKTNATTHRGKGRGKERESRRSADTIRQRWMFRENEEENPRTAARLRRSDLDLALDAGTN